jgi:glucoamylase
LSLLDAIIKFSSGVGLVPEQAWEDPDLPASPFGSDPATASIGFTDGQAAGSASPLTWAQAQEVRLILSLRAGRNVDTPAVTSERYVAHGAPGALPVTITAPASGSTLAVSATTVTGTTTPGASVTVSSDDVSTGAAATVASTVAAADGSFSVSVPVSFGSNVITVSATAPGGRSTGYGQVTVTNEGGGSTVLDVTDPAGDDNGPGTYQYPTDSSFAAGSFDLTRYQVLSDGTFAYLRVTLRTLVPTFGVIDGAQLLDVYVHVPGASSTSTAAPFPSRNYTIATSGAWSQRVEVQGFAAPVWVDASGNSVGTPSVLASQSDRTITIALPEAQFGTPGSGWGFSVVLTGQDGFSPDQARGFAATAQPFLFGVCADGGTSPICSVDPATVPKAVDVITPAGTSQASELDPTLGPVVIRPVPVP